MEHLVRVASAGMERQGASTAIDDPEMGDLQALLPADGERRFLLEAGLLAVYTQAGWMPPPLAPIEPAPAESLQPCSKAAGEILTAMLAKDPSPQLRASAAIDVSRGSIGLSGDHVDLLPEALELLRHRRLRLRHVLLPSVLPARTAALRRALLPVIGERGRWLARLNPDWKWVLTMDGNEVGEQTSLSSDADARLMQLLTDPSAGSEAVFLDVLRVAKGPWPEELSRAYVNVLRQTIAELAEGTAPPGPWLTAILPGARCIAPAVIDLALALLPPPAGEVKALELWPLALAVAREKLQLRRRLIEELTA
jgi:hypothetical protein